MNVRGLELFLALLCAILKSYAQCEGEKFAKHIQYPVGEERFSKNAHMEYFTSYLDFAEIKEMGEKYILLNSSIRLKIMILK